MLHPIEKCFEICWYFPDCKLSEESILDNSMQIIEVLNNELVRFLNKMKPLQYCKPSVYYFPISMIKLGQAVPSPLHTIHFFYH